MREYGMEDVAAPLVEWLNKRTDVLTEELIHQLQMGGKVKFINEILAEVELRPKVVGGKISWGAGKANAVVRMLQLAEGGQIRRIVQCAQCSKWLYARFEHMEYCSVECQQKFNRDSPEFREHRRKYARRRRAK